MARIVETGYTRVADVEAANQAILQWLPKVRSALKANAARFSDGKKGMVMRGSRTEKKLSDSITSNTGKESGEITRAGFRFERHGVFVHKGVGRGHPISGGMVIKDPSGVKRTGVEWFNPTLEKYVPELANQIAEINADLAVKATNLYIK